MRSIMVVTALAVLVSSTGLAWSRAVAEDNGPFRVEKTGIGTVLADPNGMTLYTDDEDTPGKSACLGECAVNWPPMTAAAGAKAGGDYGLITRDDGSLQWSDEGKPLYRFAKDRKPGDILGDVVPGWHAVKEDAD